MIDIILNKVSDTINKFDMFDKSERLLVCLSGGADSVSLLLCLKKLGYDICACHVNHQLRGDESDRDEKFCICLCERLGVELFTYKVNVIDYCKENNVSVEEGARELRYSIFSSVNADKICTAHTLSDCIETTVFNLARGTGLRGLCSIPPKRDNIVRPLIECTREEITAFLHELGQDHVTDSTNLTDEYTRNRIRHNIIPQLESINPSLMKSFANTLQYLRKDMEYLERCAEKAFDCCCTNNRLHLDTLGQYDDCIKDRVLIMWLKANNITASHDKIPLIYGIINNSGRLNISGSLFVICKNGELFLERTSTSQDQPSDISPIIVDADGKYSFSGRVIEFRTVKMEDTDCDASNVHKKFANCCMDYDKIIGGLVLRRHNEGDTIHLVNRDVEYRIGKLLKKTFPSGMRSKALILYDDLGAVFVEGSGVSERVKITGNTERLLTFEIDNII